MIAMLACRGAFGTTNDTPSKAGSDNESATHARCRQHATIGTYGVTPHVTMTKAILLRSITYWQIALCFRGPISVPGRTDRTASDDLNTHASGQPNDLVQACAVPTASRTGHVGARQVVKKIDGARTSCRPYALDQLGELAFTLDGLIGKLPQRSHHGPY